MNQKDYKAIAEIIFGHTDKSETKLVWMFNNAEDFIKDLADYFEKTTGTYKDVLGKDMVGSMGEKSKVFDREQFLKDCGITE